MDAGFVTAVLAGVGAITGSVLTYLGVKHKQDKNFKINDRMQLSKDQWQLINELKGMIEGQRTEIDGLRREIRDLQALNMQLTVDNKNLQSKLSDLSKRLDKRAEV